MKFARIALACCLLAVPASIAATAVVHPATAATATATGALGDLTAMRTIVTDTQSLIDAGDRDGAKTKITEFESAWDNAAADLQARDSKAWDAVDVAADNALDAVRTDAATDAVTAALSGLVAQLDNPGLAVNGVATTDTSGKPVPCEDLLAQFRTAKAAATLDTDTAAKVADLESKGVERCNADDDKRADGFFADGIKLMGQ